MSNTVKIKNKKKKKELKINYKLWAIVFAIFVAIIVGLAVWASFHWGVGMGTIGVEPVDPQEASVSATDAASEFSTEDVITLTPEQLQQLQQQQAAQEGAGAVEDALSDSVEEAAGTEAAEGEQKAEGEEKADGK
ncbi:MAG: hypothetical protein IJH81_10600 [Lachnospiraceae bacterium]|nr:hypothetical protein [Lachnospiraceae bacterium]